MLWGEALAAYARINIGDDPPSLEEQVGLYRRKALPKSQLTTFSWPAEQSNYTLQGNEGA